MDFDLERFVQAQDGMWSIVLAELSAGRKVSHWMWFVFPQIAGLGRSEMARRYAIGSLAEARAYLDHPVLGPRLAAARDAALAGGEEDALRLFGPIDAAKFRSSMTLFARAADDPAPFRRALVRFYGGAEDRRTLALLGL